MNKESIMKRLEGPMNRMTATMMEFAWKDPKHYATWLAQTHYYVLHSTRLLALAASRFPMNDQPFHQRFLQHCAEEKGHEKLTVNDMKTMGFDIKDFPELFSTASLYQTQYFWIEHDSPMSFFGYVLALEYLSVKFAPTLNKKIEEIHGKKAASFLRVHGEEDVGHVEKAVEKICDLDPQTMEKIFFNYEQSLNNYQKMVEECASFSKRASKAA